MSLSGRKIAASLPLLLQGAAWQHPGIDGFDVGCLHCRNIDLTLSYHYYVIGRLGRADSDGKHQGPFTGGGHTQVCGTGAYVLFHIGSDLERKGFGGHLTLTLQLD